MNIVAEWFDRVDRERNCLRTICKDGLEIRLCRCHVENTSTHVSVELYEHDVVLAQDMLTTLPSEPSDNGEQIFKEVPIENAIALIEQHGGLAVDYDIFDIMLALEQDWQEAVAVADGSYNGHS